MQRMATARTMPSLILSVYFINRTEREEINARSGKISNTRNTLVGALRSDLASGAALAETCDRPGSGNVPNNSSV
jgi:hypothetical protein